MKKNCRFVAHRKNSKDFMNLNDLGKLVGKFVFPILMLAAGIALVLTGMSTAEIENVECKGEIIPKMEVQQTDYFRYAGYGFLLLSVISALFVANIINRLTAIILAITVFPAIFAVMSWMSVDSVQEQLAWREQKEIIYAATKQRLKDIRDAQVEYKVKYSRYAPSFDKLIHFLENDKVANIKKEGTPPDRKITLKEAYLLGYDTIKFLINDITELQAVMLGQIARDPARQQEINELFGNSPTKVQFLELSKIIRDTSYVSVIDKLFFGPSAKTRDENFPFQLDSLPYRPLSGGKIALTMIVDSLQKADSVYAPVFLVKDPAPFKFRYLDDDCKPRDTLMIGSLTSTSTNGNWK